MRKVITVLVVIGICFLAVSSSIADVTPATHRPVMVAAAECAKTTTAWAVAGTTRYGMAGPLNIDTFDCRNAEELVIYWSLTGNCGSTSEVAVAVEWVLEPHSSSQGGGRISSGYTGCPLVSGWSWIDPATSSTVSSTGYRMIQVPVKAPYFRFAMTKEAIDAHSDNSISARYVLRGRATNRPGGPD